MMMDDGVDGVARFLYFVGMAGYGYCGSLGIYQIRFFLFQMYIFCAVCRNTSARKCGKIMLVIKSSGWTQYHVISQPKI